MGISLAIKQIVLIYLSWSWLISLMISFLSLAMPPQIDNDLPCHTVVSSVAFYVYLGG